MGLTDPYYQRPYVPADSVTQDRQRAEQVVPQAGMQLQQQRMQQAELAYQNAPINPFEQDLMDLVNDKIGVKELAAKHRSMGTFGGGQGANTGMIAGGAAVQMPQPIGNRDASLDRRAAELGARESMMDRSGMAGPVSVPQQQDPRQAMTRRQYQDYMTRAGGILNSRQQRDYLAELMLKNQGSKDVANIGADAKRDVAETTSTGRQVVANTNADARVTSAQIGADQRADTAHDRIEQRKAEQRQKKQYDDEYLKILRERIAASERNSTRIAGTKGKKNPKIDALVKLVNKDKDEYARLASSDVQIVDKKANETKLKTIADRMEENLAKLELELERAETETTETTSTTTETSKKTPGVMVKEPGSTTNLRKKYEIGKTYNIGGKKRRVNSIDPDGTLHTTVVP